MFWISLVIFMLLAFCIAYFLCSRDVDFSLSKSGVSFVVAIITAFVVIFVAHTLREVTPPDTYKMDEIELEEHDGIYYSINKQNVTYYSDGGEHTDSYDDIQIIKHSNGNYLEIKTPVYSGYFADVPGPLIKTAIIHLKD